MAPLLHKALARLLVVLVYELATACTAANALSQLSVSCSREMTLTAIASLVLSLALFASTVFTISIKLVAEKIQEHGEEDMFSAAAYVVAQGGRGGVANIRQVDGSQQSRAWSRLQSRGGYGDNGNAAWQLRLILAESDATLLDLDLQDGHF